MPSSSVRVSARSWTPPAPPPPCWNAPLIFSWLAPLKSVGGNAGILTRRSRGIDSRYARSRPTGMCTMMIVSERWPSSGSLARRSEPRSRKLSGPVMVLRRSSFLSSLLARALLPRRFSWWTLSPIPVGQDLRAGDGGGGDNEKERADHDEQLGPDRVAAREGGLASLALLPPGKDAATVNDGALPGGQRRQQRRPVQSNVRTGIRRSIRGDGAGFQSDIRTGIGRRSEEASESWHPKERRTRRRQLQRRQHLTAHRTSPKYPRWRSHPRQKPRSMRRRRAGAGDTSSGLSAG